MIGVARTWQYTAIIASGGPQPLFGTLLTGTVTPLADASGSYSGQGTPFTPTIVLPVTSGTGKLFNVHDELQLWRVANTGNLPDGKTHIVSISGDNLTVKNFKGPSTALTTGDFVILNQPCSSVYVESLVGNTGVVGLGRGPLVSLSTGFQLITAVMIPVPSPGSPSNVSVSDLYGANPDSTANYWVVGTATDKFLPSCLTT